MKWNHCGKHGMKLEEKFSCWYLMERMKNVCTTFSGNEWKITFPSSQITPQVFILYLHWQISLICSFFWKLLLYKKPFWFHFWGLILIFIFYTTLLYYFGKILLVNFVAHIARYCEEEWVIIYVGVLFLKFPVCSTILIYR